MQKQIQIGVLDMVRYTVNIIWTSTVHFQSSTNSKQLKTLNYTIHKRVETLVLPLIESVFEYLIISVGTKLDLIEKLLLEVNWSVQNCPFEMKDTNPDVAQILVLQEKERS